MDLFMENKVSLAGKFFNPQNGVVHFYIRPEDNYITQYLQIYDSDEYLYALLKSEGYENIVFGYFDDNGSPKGYSFDEKSVKFFYSYGKSENPDLGTTDYSCKIECKERQYRGASPEETVDSFFSKIRRALRDKRTKTAIVMPFEELRINLKLAKIEPKREKNILVLTEVSAESFIYNCAGDVLKALQKYPDFRGCRSGSRVFERLRGKSNLVVMGEVATDEIAFLLYYEKMMNRKLKAVPYYAINTIADMIRLQFSGKCDYFENLPDELSVKSLQLWLENDATGAELAEKAKAINDIKEICCNKGLYLRRMYSDFVCSSKHKKDTPLITDETGAYLSKKSLEELSRLEEISSCNKEILVDRLMRSVPYVVDEKDPHKSKGTAFIITPDGYALTCTHVVGDKAEVSVSFSEEAFQTKKEFLCKVINKLSIDGHDVTLLKIQSDEEFSYIPLSKDDKLSRSDEFITAGYSGALDRLSSVEVKISVTGIENKDEKVFGLDRMLYSGCSGSPFVSIKDGCVKGIFFGDIVIKNGSLSCGKPVKYLWDWFTR